jgi:WD40 repeat protein
VSEPPQHRLPVDLANWSALVGVPAAAPKHVAQLDPGCETNGLSYDAQTDTLFAATGDGICHGYDASSGKETAACSGHTNYLHAVVVLPKSRQLATGSEDGTVRLWDLRSDAGASCTCTLEPFSDADGETKERRNATARSVSTSWVSCLACDPNDNWLVCGGSGHYLNTYHIGSRKSMNTMPTASATQAVSYVESELVSVGAEPNVYHHSIGGTLVARVPATCPSNFGIAYSPSPHGRLLVVSGAGTAADVFTDFHSPPAYSTSLLFNDHSAAAVSG